ncbi:MAG: ABC transporter permease subunit [Candidatus Symbiobacter sp.]|nr:ABC transporter permease subunit [Candidatus Symbiobacter sp.]
MNQLDSAPKLNGVNVAPTSPPLASPSLVAKTLKTLRKFASNHAKWLIIAPPLLYLIAFFLIPFFLALKISLSLSILAAPPFTETLARGENGEYIFTFHMVNYNELIHDWNLFWQDVSDLGSTVVNWVTGLFREVETPVSDREGSRYIDSFITSLRFAAVGTFFCLLIGYPCAYAIARAPKSQQNLFLMLIILPFWTSFLLRIYALQGVLRPSGVLNKLLLWIGVIDEPLRILQTAAAVQIGVVYSYAPFMILPLFATLQKLDPALLEAAYDLGAKPFRAFWNITVPLSLPGVIAGAMLTFIPMMGEYIIPDMMGGPGVETIGRVLWNMFFDDHNWPMAAAFSIAFLLFLVVPIAIYQYYSIREREA